MSIMIGDYEFEGPFTSLEAVEAESGICALLSEHKQRGIELIELIDLNNVRTFWDEDEYVSNNRFWTETCHGKLAVAVLYTRGLSTRERVELRKQLTDQMLTARKRARTA